MKMYWPSDRMGQFKREFKTLRRFGPDRPVPPLETEHKPTNPLLRRAMAIARRTK